MNRWLAYLGYFFSIFIIILHAIYIGNNLIYKVDNLLILAQTYYFFQFIHILAGNYLSQFYYGWRWSHGGFFPNFFSGQIPTGYFEEGAPEAYKLISFDSNLVRNAGFSFSLFAVFLAAWLLLTFLVVIVYKCCSRKEICYPTIAKNSLIAGIEFFAMNIFYWSVAFMKYRNNGFVHNDQDNFFDNNKTAAIVFIAVYGAYAFIRFCFNQIGGLYMFKRLIIATLLVVAVTEAKWKYLLLMLAL